jgi:hypothetical protein
MNWWMEGASKHEGGLFVTSTTRPIVLHGDDPTKPLAAAREFDDFE